MVSEETFKRINILVRQSQYERVQNAGLNLSGLVRDLLDDRFSHRKVVLAVSPEVRALYDEVISNFGATDSDLERALIRSLEALLKEKQEAISNVLARISKGSEGG